MAKLLFFKPRLNAKPSFKFSATLTLLILSQTVVADQRPLYQWQDAQGVWYFSDRKPQDPQLIVKSIKRMQRSHSVATVKPDLVIHQTAELESLEGRPNSEYTLQNEACLARFRLSRDQL